jgi:hypothetical protein
VLSTVDISNHFDYRLTGLEPSKSRLALLNSGCCAQDKTDGAFEPSLPNAAVKIVVAL